jgi:2-isopropylmalate synthase
MSSETGLEPIQLARWTVTSGSNVNSRAAVVLHAGSHDWQASAEGNGAVDALLRAVDQALRDVLGGQPRLLAYDVHALAEGPDAEGRVTVQIAPPALATGGRADGRFSGEVASTNIVAASVEAYILALNAMLVAASWAGAAAEASARRDAVAGADDGAAGAMGAELGDESTIDTTAWFNR